ncbi:MAG: hypothetical protein H6Q12_753 [Bacteroidetes bacterium]|nr:hypothetical protein [Bacteroidota bacterium]
MTKLYVNAFLLKKLIFIFIFSCSILSGFAKSRTSNEALSIASCFSQKSQVLTKTIGLPNSTLTLAYTCKDSIITRSSTEKAYYYVFNIGDNNGFIIVSGDDRAKDILGYSHHGIFNSDSLPPNFSTWLNLYQKEIKVLMNQPEELSYTSSVSLSPTENTTTNKTIYATSVAPLLGGIKWDQGTPYNELCPTISTKSSERTVTGCVATAMAQVMRYHQWPITGKGSNTYTPDGYFQALTVDFSKTTYDWKNMTETYNSLSTATEKTAIATLMYHCGVAVNMDYGFSSSASPTNMAKALIKYFSYDPNIQSYHRDYYTRSEWENMLKTELNAKRPVLYAGNSTDAGHQFVCDGYDSNDRFHFNWGWSGESDGYFELSALNPSALGIGGGTSGGFNSDQLFVIGVQKPNETSVAAPYQLHLYSPLKISANSISRTNTFSINADIYNMGITNFSGSIGLALYNENGFVKLIKSYSVSSLDTYYGWSGLEYSSSIPTDVINGNYKLYSVFLPSGKSEWQIMRGKVGTANYLNVAVTSSNVTFSIPNVLPNLTQNSLSTIGNLYQNSTGRFNVNLTNTGGEYNSNLVILLKSAENDSISQVVCMDPVNISTGETKSLDFLGNITLPTGKYYLYVMYDPQNDRSNTDIFNNIGSPINVEILSTSIETPALTLTSKISFPDPSQVNGNDAILTARIKNTGGYFDDYLVAFVYPVNSYIALSFFGFQKIILDKDEEKTITLSGNIGLEPGSYLTVLAYSTTLGNSYSFMDPNDYSKIVFTITDNTTKATDIEQTKEEKPYLYPIPATDILYLKSDDVVKTINIMDLSGKLILKINPLRNGEISIPVNTLKAGAYILQSITETEEKVCKFIKK